MNKKYHEFLILSNISSQVNVVRDKRLLPFGWCQKYQKTCRLHRKSPNVNTHVGPAEQSPPCLWTLVRLSRNLVFVLFYTTTTFRLSFSEPTLASLWRPFSFNWSTIQDIGYNFSVPIFRILGKCILLQFFSRTDYGLNYSKLIKFGL